jgi:hypothetical protein
MRRCALGGLVSLGDTAQLSRILTRALEYARNRSSDPLCAERAPSGTATPCTPTSATSARSSPRAPTSGATDSSVGGCSFRSGSPSWCSGEHKGGVGRLDRAALGARARAVDGRGAGGPDQRRPARAVTTTYSLRRYEPVRAPPAAALARQVRVAIVVETLAGAKSAPLRQRAGRRRSPAFAGVRRRPPSRPLTLAERKSRRTRRQDGRQGRPRRWSREFTTALLGVHLQAPSSHDSDPPALIRLWGVPPGALGAASSP